MITTVTVTHAVYGWKGYLGFGHTDGKLMVIWTEHNGASLHSPEDLIIDLEV